MEKSLKFTIDTSDMWCTIEADSRDGFRDFRMISMGWLGPFVKKSPESLEGQINKAKDKMKKQYDVHFKMLKEQ